MPESREGVDGRGSPAKAFNPVLDPSQKIGHAIEKALSQFAMGDWFTNQLLAWFDRHGRKDLPWQRQPTPYRVWISEVMLQQTQVQTVIPYYERFMERFPDLGSLAAANLDEVLNLWTGLGYYARARNLHRAAQRVAKTNGALPATRDKLEALPGIGRSTAAAILALAHGQPAAILDGNAKRVLSRFHAVDGNIARSSTLKRLWNHAETHTPRHPVANYTQAIMDLGATVCLRRAPRCDACPVSARCKALESGRAEDYPMRQRARAKPVRGARMYVITTDRGACLLERRTLGGVWGGLWTPPQRGVNVPPEQVCREFGIRDSAVTKHRTGALFRHTFSHFHLDIEPHHLELNNLPALIADHGEVRWYHPASHRDFGLPAPVLRLLASLSAEPGRAGPDRRHTPPEAARRNAG